MASHPFPQHSPISPDTAHSHLPLQLYCLCATRQYHAEFKLHVVNMWGVYVVLLCLFWMHSCLLSQFSEWRTKKHKKARRNELLSAGVKVNKSLLKQKHGCVSQVQLNVTWMIFGLLQILFQVFTFKTLVYDPLKTTVCSSWWPQEHLKILFEKYSLFWIALDGVP